jgi:hypothetical protein
VAGLAAEAGFELRKQQRHGRAKSAKRVFAWMTRPSTNRKAGSDPGLLLSSLRGALATKQSILSLLVAAKLDCFARNDG